MLDNFKEICEALRSIDIIKTETPDKLGTVILTYYPTIAEFFMEKYPCSSIVNFILDYQEGGKWPYTRGIYNKY